LIQFRRFCRINPEAGDVKVYQHYRHAQFFMGGVKSVESGIDSQAGKTLWVGQTLPIACVQAFMLDERNQSASVKLPGNADEFVRVSLIVEGQWRRRQRRSATSDS
jgi:hypothetical protein